MRLRAGNSKKQKMVTRSTSESELLSLSGAINQGAGIAKFLHEVKLIEQDGFEMRQDNKSTITIAVNGEGMGGKARHFRVRHEFMREMHRDKKMMIVYCATENMLADFLTKSVGSKGFRFQVVRAMYHGDEREFYEQEKRIRERVGKEK